MTFEHEVCPVCGQPFGASDDVVVCPDCGTPHHRACWTEHGGCANAGQHESGFVWQPGHADSTAQEPREEHAEEYGTVRCPRCGEECEPDALVCPVCGKQLGVAANSRFDFNDEFFLRGVDADPDADLDGFSVREASMFVQFRAKDYVRKFTRMKNGRKAGWNWAALFFAPYWFFYRKIYKAGLLFMGVLLVLSLFMAVPLQKAQDQMYKTLDAYITLDENLSFPDQLAAATDAFNKLESAAQQKIVSAMERNMRVTLLYAGVLFVPNIAAAILADFFYKKKIAKDVQSLREFSKNAQTFRMLTLRRGGVSVLGLAASYMLVSLLRNLIILYQ